MSQDYTITLKPGGAENITIGEVEFVFIKAAGGPVLVDIDNAVTLMEVNEQRRPGKRFDQFVMKNPDPVNELTVTYVAGIGDYRTQTIKGQLNVVPSIIKSDGAVLPDTRYFLDLTITPDQVFTGQVVENGEIIERYQLRTWASGGPTTRGCGAGFTDSGTVFLVDEVKNNSGNMSVVISEYDVETGSVYRTTTFSGFGSINGKEPQSLIWLDDNRLLMGSANGGVWLLNYGNPGNVSQLGSFSSESAANITAYVGGTALGLSADRRTLYQLARVSDLTYRVEKAAFDEATVTMGSVANVLEHTVSTYWTYVNCHWITEVNGKILFHLQTYRSAGEVFGDQVYDLTNTVQTDFGTNLGRFNPGATANDTVRFYAEQRPDGRLEVINEVNNGNTYYGVHWEANTEFSAKARVSDNGPGGLVSILKPQDAQLITANVNATYLNNGRFKVSGEVIRYALQLYLRKLDISGYLDALFGLEIPETGGSPGWEQILTGNESFQRASIEDNFSIILPGTLRLYVDNNLLRNL